MGILIIENFINIFVLLSFLLKLSGGNQESKGRLIWGKRSNDTYLQFQPLSIVKCALECQIRRRCVSINYSYALKFCELNHKLLSGSKMYEFDEESDIFVYSEMTSWPQLLTEKCTKITCAENEACDYKNGNCRVSDCGAVNFTIPDNANLEYYGSHEVGNGVGLKCTRSNFMYNKQTGRTLVTGYVMCGKTGQWEDINFMCKACDIEKLYIDENSEIINLSWNDLGFEFRCKSGYQAYSHSGEPITGNNIVTCHDGGEWTGTDFFCKRAETLARDFCPKSYVYDEKNTICYKYNDRQLVQGDASRECSKEKAHLLSISKSSMAKFAKRFSDNSSLFVDGFWNDTEWRNWANEKMLYIKSENISGSENKECIASVNGVLKATSCRKALKFICQFEICPESAGYTYKYDDNQELCYKVMPENNFYNRVCHICDQNRYSCTESPYDPHFIIMDSTNDIIIKGILHGNGILTSHKAYKAYADKNSHQESRRRCSKNNMKLAKLDTKDKRDIAAEIMALSVKHAWIGLHLDVGNTYNYTTVDRQPLTLKGKPNVIENTDEQKCIVIKRNSGVLRSMNCSIENFYLCTSQKHAFTKADIVIPLLRKSFDEAYADCKTQNKNLIQTISQSSLDVAMDFLMDYQNTSRNNTLRLYVDLRLLDKNYIYRWSDGKLVEEIEFDQFYSNNTKDFKKAVLFNATTTKFMLAAFKEGHPRLCETKRGVMWISGTNETDLAHTLDKKMEMKPMPCNNRLPYICEIKTNDVIRNWKLFNKKKLFL